MVKDLILYRTKAACQIKPDGEKGIFWISFADGNGGEPVKGQRKYNGENKITPIYEELVLPAGDVKIVGVVVATIRWLDERLSCRDVCMGVRPSFCSMLVSNGMTAARVEQEPKPVDYPDGTCMLYPPRPCAFDDPRFDWTRVKRIRQQNVQARVEKSEGG